MGSSVIWFLFPIFKNFGLILGNSHPHVKNFFRGIFLINLKQKLVFFQAFFRVGGFAGGAGKKIKILIIFSVFFLKLNGNL